MRSSRFLTLTLLATTMALAACNDDGSASASGSTPLVQGETAKGELTSQSTINVNDGSRYQVLPVNLPAGKATRIELEGALKGRLSLFSNNELIAASGVSCCSDFPQAPYIIVSSKTGGDYQLGVSGIDANSYGPFSVKATASDIRNSGPLAVSETLTGWMNGAVSQTAAQSNTYDLTVTETGAYEFTLRSKEFDAHLTLTGVGINVRDDDGAGESDARITAFLEPGAYQLKAEALHGANAPGAGLYTLTSAVPQTPNGVAFQRDGAVAMNTTIASILMQNLATYEISVEETSLVTLQMHSEQLDSQLTLQGPGVTLQNDDFGDGRDSRIETVLQPGKYRVLANGVGGGSGLFTLSVQSTEAPPAGGGDIEVGDQKDAYLTTGSSDVYQLKVARAGHYSIYLGSEQFDSLLQVQGNGVEVSDDDSGNNYDAMLELDLQPGVYTITATSADNSAGMYQLSVQ